MDEEAHHEFRSYTEGSDHSSYQVASGDRNENTKQKTAMAKGRRFNTKLKVGAKNDQLLQVCYICNKGFSSGKALGGHMRMHDIASNNCKKAQHPNGNGGAKPNTWMLVGTPTCCLCNKNFPSMKSLFGHMRSHPGREWKGIQPPTTSPPQPSRSTDGAHLSSSASSSTLCYYDHIDSVATSSTVGSVVDLSGCLSSWSVTAKRGRKSLAPNTDSGFSPSIGKRLEEGVYELMMLAYANPKQDVEVATEVANNSTFDIEGAVVEEKRPVLQYGGTPKGKLAGEVHEFSVPPTKKLKIEGEITFMDGGRKILGFAPGDDLESDIQNTDGCAAGECLSLDPEMKKKENKQKQKKMTRKVKLSDLETTQESNHKLVMGTGTLNYRSICSICNKSFPSHQALGGHRSSHNKIKNIQIMDESESADVSAAEEENHTKFSIQVDEAETVTTGAEDAVRSSLQVREHQCNICNKTFPTGQALGGHKRSHWTGTAEAQPQSAQATSPGENSESCTMVLNFDLNQPPAMGEEDNVQSDLFIPAAGNASFSVTN